jgi:hypothetical protein
LWNCRIENDKRSFMGRMAGEVEYGEEASGGGKVKGDWKIGGRWGRL